MCVCVCVCVGVRARACVCVCVRVRVCLYCITPPTSDTDVVDDDGAEVVEYEARVGMGVQITASAAFAADNNLAIALSNMTCKFIEIPAAAAAAPSSPSSPPQPAASTDVKEISAIAFVPAADAAADRHVLAFTCRHPHPNNVSACSYKSSSLDRERDDDNNTLCHSCNAAP